MEILHERLLPLLYRWVQRRERQASGKSMWPSIGYRVERKGLAYETTAVGFELSRSTAAREYDDVDAMGECVLALPEWKAAIIWIWATTDATDEGLKQWDEHKASWKLSDKKLRSILLDLQEEAIRRGLLT